MARSMFALDSGAAGKRHPGGNVFDLDAHREPSVEEVAILPRDRRARTTPPSAAPLAARPEDRPAQRPTRRSGSWKVLTAATLAGLAITATALALWELGGRAPAMVEPSTQPATTSLPVAAPDAFTSLAMLRSRGAEGDVLPTRIPGTERRTAPALLQKLSAAAPTDSPPTVNLLGPDATFVMAVTNSDVRAPLPIEAATGLEQRLAPVLPRAFLRAPNPLADERPAATAALTPPRVVVHYAGRAEARALQIAQTARATLGTEIEVRRVDLGVSRTNVRYFHGADLTLARFVAGLSGSADLRDFTTFEPRPRRGLIEVWLAP